MPTVSSWPRVAVQVEPQMRGASRAPSRRYLAGSWPGWARVVGACTCTSALAFPLFAGLSQVWPAPFGALAWAALLVATFLGFFLWSTIRDADTFRDALGVFFTPRGVEQSRRSGPVGHWEDCLWFLLLPAIALSDRVPLLWLPAIFGIRIATYSIRVVGYRSTGLVTRKYVLSLLPTIVTFVALVVAVALQR